MSDIVFDGMIFDRLREIGDQSDRIASLEAEIARLRLTTEEREAIDKAAHAAAQLYAGPDGVGLAATLRRLLERLT